MTRSLWKGVNVQMKGTKNIWARGGTILTRDIGTRLNVHNGQKFVEIRVEEPMVGHKYGEFAITRVMGVGIHVDKKRKKKKK